MTIGGPRVVSGGEALMLRDEDKEPQEPTKQTNMEGERTWRAPGVRDAF